jgi:hypothetical protein
MKIFKFFNRVVCHVLAVVSLISSGMILQSTLMALNPEGTVKFYGAYKKSEQ